ncbi:MAG: SH3 domain-containing protein [Elusimicrobiota bacterium]
MDLSSLFKNKTQVVLKDTLTIFFVIGFYFSYSFIPPINKITLKVIQPVVGGMTMIYSKFSQIIYLKFKKDIGFLPPKINEEFDLKVKIAQLVNERDAESLILMSSDPHLNKTYREWALQNLLKFDSPSEWIQPFLNELPKGGMIEVNDEKTPNIDLLIMKIKAVGGNKQNLIRAYDEVVFNFMIKANNPNMRKNAFRWLNDVMPTDAVFFFANGLRTEKDPSVQSIIDEGLWNVRVISDPVKAEKILAPYYRVPPWRTAKPPLMLILSRLGTKSPREAISFLLKTPNQLNAEQLAALKSAFIKFPNSLEVDDKEKTMIAERKMNRVRQYQLALNRQYEIEKKDRLKKWEESKKVSKVSVELKPLKEEKSVSIPEIPKEVKIPKPEIIVTPEKTIPENKVAQIVSKNEEVKKAIPVELPTVTVIEETIVEKEPIQQIAKLPEKKEEILPPPPPIEDIPQLVVSPVDMIFEVKTTAVPLFENPGDATPIGTVLPVGSKGKAKLEAILNEVIWYQVDSKKGKGWAKGSLLSIYNLSPNYEEITEKSSVTSNKDASAQYREEQTYFAPNFEKVPFFDIPSDSGKEKGNLVEGNTYLAIKSEKVEADRWFLLKVDEENQGWVRGIDIILADVLQPNQLNRSDNPMSLRTKKSAFSAEWIIPIYKGVYIYSRPTLTSKKLEKINPPDIFKIVELSQGGDSEWYKIQYAAGKNGWVQTMDVNLTKPAQ